MVHVLIARFWNYQMPPKSRVAIVLSCEHAGNQIPPAMTGQFRGAQRVLESHRGWDPGALPLAQQFSKVLSVPLTFSSVSRLVVEPNRSIGHPQLFSEFTRNKSREEKQRLVERYWKPHREAVTDLIAARIQQRQIVIHLSVHTFTQHFGSEVRKTDIGLLYDPQRRLEQHFCAIWRETLKETDPDWVVRRNDPYKGSSDGFTTHLRKQFEATQYLGIELEVCQKFFLKGGLPWKQVLMRIPQSFCEAVRRHSENL